MSTFKGIVEEFPEIRIDYFRPSNNPNDKPPLACFLSHIHTDHLQGLEGSYYAPFIYCSAATKELLPRLQRKVHRFNLQKGIVETEKCQYKDKGRLLRSIPLETPTEVEVRNDKKVRVTLFDANHCVGAVMFLIEGDGKAILYTGDIRAEDWWIEYLARHPILVPYTSGVRRLDKIYLDTSWGIRGCEKKFPTKREGISELLRQLVKYPKDTIFHLNTWTFGYEEVWVALASFFDSQIHLSRYHYQLFRSIKGADMWTNGPYLGGFNLGHASQPQIITTNPDVKIHSCERNIDCPGLNHKKVVYITPTIAVVNGVLFQEDGIDYGDLNNNQDFSIYGQFQILLDILGDEVTSEVRDMLLAASKTRKEIVPLPFDEFGERRFDKQHLLEMLKDAARVKQEQRQARADAADLHQNWPGTESIKADDGELLPTWIRFPYSRHSSLGELRNFVAAFGPRDIYQNTCDGDIWTEANSVERLYGDLCSGKEFSHDVEMRRLYHYRLDNQAAQDFQLQEMELDSQQKNLFMSQHQDRSSSIGTPEMGEETQQLERLEAVVKAKQAREEAEHMVWAEKKTSSSGLSSSPPATAAALSSPPGYCPEIPLPPWPQFVARGKPNSNGIAEMLSTPVLPPVILPSVVPQHQTDAGVQFLSSSFTATHHSRRPIVMGTSTASNSPTVSPVKPIPAAEKQNSLEAANKRRKLSTSASNNTYVPEDSVSPLNSALCLAMEIDMAEDPILPLLEKPLAVNTLDEHNTEEESSLPKKDDIVPQIREKRRGIYPDLSGFAGSLVDGVLADLEDKSLEKDWVEEAVRAALGIGSENWWSIELESTKRRWRYEIEDEL